MWTFVWLKKVFNENTWSPTRLWEEVFTEHRAKQAVIDKMRNRLALQHRTFAA